MGFMKFVFGSESSVEIPSEISTMKISPKTSSGGIIRIPQITDIAIKIKVNDTKSTI